MDENCVYKKISGSGFVFLILYVENILLIKKKWHFFTWVSKNLVAQEFLHEGYIWEKPIQ